VGRIFWGEGGCVSMAGIAGCVGERGKYHPG
jgi:hypothetical protein